MESFLLSKRHVVLLLVILLFTGYVLLNISRVSGSSNLVLTSFDKQKDNGDSQSKIKSLIPPSQDAMKQRISDVLGTLDPPYNLSKIMIHQSYYFPNINIFFTGIPKAGCSNWEEALLRAEGRLSQQLDPKKVSRVHGGMTNRYRMPNYKGNGEDVNSAISIVVLRNPWTRAVSGYRQKLSSEETQGSLMEILSKQVVKILRPLNDTNPDPLCTFEEFIKYSIKVGGIKNYHFKPQVKFLSVDIIRYDKIIPLEYADMMADELFRELNKNVSILHSYDKITDPRQQSSALKAKQWLTELSEKNPKLVEDFYKIYQKDFDLLKYSNFSDPNFPLPLI